MVGASRVHAHRIILEFEKLGITKLRPPWRVRGCPGRSRRESVCAFGAVARCLVALRWRASVRASYGLDAGAMVARLDAGAAVPSPVPVAMPRFSPLWPLGTLPHPLDAVVNLFNAGGYRRFPASELGFPDNLRAVFYFRIYDPAPYPGPVFFNAVIHIPMLQDRSPCLAF